MLLVEASMLQRKLAVVACSLCLVLSSSGFADARRAYRVAAQYSAAECDTYAAQYARRASAEGELLFGGGIGGLAGFGIGSIFAASGIGAAVGVGAGLLVGAIVRSQREQQLYAASYQDCMSGRRY